MIDAILDDDKQRPAKQRHSAKRIFDRLKEEHQFTGGYTIVKDYVRSAELHIQFADLPKDRQGPTARFRGHPFDRLCFVHGIEHRLTKPTIPGPTGRSNA